MSQFYVTGPAYVWAGVGASNAYAFVGFTEHGVNIQIHPRNEDIPVDYAGMMPGDVSQLGQEATVQGTFKRFNDAVIQQLVSFPGYNVTPGMGPNDSVGSLIVSESLSYPLLIYCPYSTKTEFSTMVPGWAFAAAYLAEPYRSPVNTRAKTVDLGWRCIPVFGSWSGTTFTAGQPYSGYNLYTNTMPTVMPAVD